MTERNEAASERLALSAVKSEVLTHELSMGDRELGLQPVPLAYPQQVGLPVCSVQYSSTTAYYLQLSTTRSTNQCPCSYLVNSTEVYFCTILLSFILSYLSFCCTHHLTLFVSISVCGCPFPYPWGSKSSGMWHGFVGCGSRHLEGLYSCAFSRDKLFKKNFSWAAWPLWWPTTVRTSNLAFPIHIYFSIFLCCVLYFLLCVLVHPVLG